jgi:putative ABC transport system permease protein
MAFWRPLVRGLRRLRRPSEADREIADEVQHFLDETAAAHRARGLTPDAAMRAARIEIGGVAHLEEDIRTAGWERAIDTAINDLRYAVRRLKGAPGFTTIATLTLALGIGATTAIFSAVNPILFARLPYAHADRIVRVLELRRDDTRNGGTFAMYRELLERARSLETVAARGTARQLRLLPPAWGHADCRQRFHGI